MRQVPDGTFGPAERLDLGAVDGERRTGGRHETLHGCRRDFQVQKPREALVDVQPIVGRRRRLFDRRANGEPAAGRGPDDARRRRRRAIAPVQQIAAAGQRQFGAPHQFHERFDVGYVVLPVAQHARHWVVGHIAVNVVVVIAVVYVVCQRFVLSVIAHVHRFLWIKKKN